MSSNLRSYAIALLALVVLLTAWASRAAEGRKSLASANAALIAGDRVEAIVFARAAAQARCPACSSPDQGYAKLEAIAKEAEGKADLPVAVAAWRAVRSAALATTLFERESSRRERAEGEIARLEHRIDQAAAAAGAQSSPAASEERLRAVLAGNDTPSALVFLLAAIGGALFLGFAQRFARAKSFRAADLAAALAGVAIAAAGVLAF